VVTEFEFQLHHLGPTVFGGMLLYPAPVAADVLRNFRDVMVSAPDEFGAGIAMITAPPEDFVPEPVRGQPVVAVVLCYAGDPDEGAEAMKVFTKFGPPAMPMVGPMPYTAVQQLIEPGNPPGLRNYWNADFLNGLPDEAIEILCDAHLRKPSPLADIVILAGGGAIARVPNDAMAFGQRGAPFNLHLLAQWPDPAMDDACISWTRETAAAMKPFTSGYAYLNFIGEEGEGRVVAAFGEETYRKLQQLKNKYDPDNVFRLNQNITPSGQDAEPVTV
jgi:FAD/FMN-containing dehydrogenase